MLLICAKSLGGCMWCLPVLTLIWIMGSCFITYGVAVANNHTFPDFPYISYTGVEVPERGIFTLTIAIGAILLAANAEMQYLFFKKLLVECRPEPTNKKRWWWVNRVALVFGMVSGLGLLFVACFQVDTMKPPHYFGAFLCFGMAMVYAWVQVGITRKIVLLDNINEKEKRTFRIVQLCQIVSSAFSTALFLTFAISKKIYNDGRDKGLGTKWDTLRAEFLTSTISEWLLTFSVTLFLLTFIPGFRKFSHTNIVIDFKSSPGHSTENDMVLAENGVENTANLMNGTRT